MLKSIKKLIGLALVSAISATMCVPTLAVSNNRNKTNIDSMFNSAVTNYKQTAKAPIYATLTNNDTGKKYKVQVFEAAPNTNNLKINTVNPKHYTKSYVFSIQKKYIQPYNNIQLDDNQSNSGWDGSISVRGYIDLEYSSDGTNTLLTNVNGGWDYGDYSVYISDREVFYACVDPDVYYSQSVLRYPDSNSFSYDTYFDHAVQEHGGATACGAHIKCTLHHGTGSWTFGLSNTLFDNFGLPDLGNR